MPVITPSKEKKEDKKQLSDDEIQKLAEEETEKEGIFSKWIFGQPFTGNDIMQIPVRFYCNYGTIDVTIYMNPNGNNEFYQITIDRWGKV